ncbi:MAG TPA: hypothetical protein VGB69_08630 [Edaphobacter sp.]
MVINSVVSEGLAERIDELVHGMCQPLTVLQCRLALGSLSGEPEAMRSAIGEALKECSRLNETVWAMRKVLKSAEGQE